MIHLEIIKKLQENRLSVGFAESCTGGGLSNLIAAEPGVSAVFKGAVVAYANEVKINLLGVDAALIEKFGAVSEPVAIAMAEGGLHRLGCDFCVSVTGIAGPSGGSVDKPVGTVYIAAAGDCAGFKQQVIARRFNFAGNRAEIQKASQQNALQLLQELLSRWDNLAKG
jgi:PncC family amidohydrolase